MNRIWCLWLNLTELICGKTCLCLYLLCKSLFVSLCFMFWNPFLLELVRRYRLASPLLMALIVVGGWYEDAWMYSCLLVGFMWVRTSKIWLLTNRLPLYRVMSRNVSSVSLNSYVNLIVWCI